MGKRSDYVWIKVTHDKFELPVAIADTATELERELGLAYGSIRQFMSRCKRRGMWCCYRKIYVGKGIE